MDAATLKAFIPVRDCDGNKMPSAVKDPPDQVPKLNVSVRSVSVGLEKPSNTSVWPVASTHQR